MKLKDICDKEVKVFHQKIERILFWVQKRSEFKTDVEGSVF